MFEVIALFPFCYHFFINFVTIEYSVFIGFLKCTNLYFFFFFFLLNGIPKSHHFVNRFNFCPQLTLRPSCNIPTYHTSMYISQTTKLLLNIIYLCVYRIRKEKLYKKITIKKKKKRKKRIGFRLMLWMPCCAFTP